VTTPTAIREYDSAAPDRSETETATFALGCFWGPDARFGALEGVVRTRVGYAGGTRRDPSYHDLGDHSEAVQVDHDPDVCSYADLLAAALDAHDPTRQTGKVQYQNVVFVDRPDQRDALETALSSRGLAIDAIETRVESHRRFHVAEDYHQKHSLRSKRALLSAFEEAGYDDAAIRESPAAATLNAELSGHDVPEGTALTAFRERASRRE